MKVISVINFKGGVGKSTVTFNLGAELSKKNKKVLLIDFDGQGNLTKFTGVDSENPCEENIITALTKIMAGEKIKKDPIYKINENLDIVPCNIQKERWSNMAVSVLARETILKRYLDGLKKRHDYDYIFIDNAPSINLDLQNSLTSADEYLVVAEPQIASTDGIEAILDVIKQIKDYFNPKLTGKGILINKAEERTNLYKIMENIIKNSWGEDLYIFDTILPKSTVVGESEFFGIPICGYKADSKIGKAFNDLAIEFLDEERSNPWH